MAEISRVLSRPMRAKEICWELYASSDPKKLAEIKRALAAMVRHGELSAKREKCYHPVRPRDNLFGGAAMGVHYELRYSKNPENGA